MSKKQSIVAAAATALLTATLIVAQPADAADVLLSRNKPTTASSVESSSYGPQMAVDGSVTTRWASAEGSDPQWIRVDLGTTVTVSRVKLVWEAAYGSAYRIEISLDGASWSVLKSVTGENGGTDDHTGFSGSGRYVRIYGTQRGTSYGYSLWELEVYGPGTTPPTPSASPSPGPGGPDYQAENATLSQASVASNHLGYTGSGFVDYTNVAGGYIQWNVTVPAAVTATLTLRYANGTTVGRPMDIAVNGTVVASGLAFDPTSNWDTWAVRAVTAALNAGSNTVRATAIGAAGGPNVDKLTVSAGPGPGPSFVVAAAGDIAEQCTASSSTCQHPKTAALVTAMNPDFVITMGDNQYDDARLSDFQNYFDKSWGKFKAKMHPAPGNHETYDPAGSMAGYRSYFGAIAYPQGKSYYSYDFGNWHFIALDSNIFDNAAQITWLRNDLAANTKGCVAAYWHHPLFSSGEHGNDPVSKPVWQILYNARADLILNGHDHHYERFGPQNPDAAADPNGLVELLGGMGGASPYDIVNVQPNSQKRLSGTFGVTKLTFTDSTYSWQLIGTDGAVKDTSPTYTCH